METKIFKKYGEIYHLKNLILNVIVDESFESDDHFISSNVKNFKDFNLSSTYDFVDLSGDNLIYYRHNSFNNRGYYDHNKPPFETFTFKKNKFYTFQTNGKLWDELNVEINQHNDIWYDAFYFVLNEDLKQAERYLKLKQLNKC